jgi:hypothetical protein
MKRFEEEPHESRERLMASDEVSTAIVGAWVIAQVAFSWGIALISDFLLTLFVCAAGVVVSNLVANAIMRKPSLMWAIVRLVAYANLTLMGRPWIRSGRWFVSRELRPAIDDLANELVKDRRLMKTKRTLGLLIVASIHWRQTVFLLVLVGESIYQALTKWRSFSGPK